MNALLVTALITCMVLLFHFIVAHAVGRHIQRRMDRDTHRVLVNAMETWQLLYNRHYHPKRRMWRFIRRHYGFDYQTLFSTDGKRYPYQY